jgi:hypothetical protein
MKERLVRFPKANRFPIQPYLFCDGKKAEKITWRA